MFKKFKVFGRKIIFALMFILISQSNLVLAAQESRYVKFDLVEGLNPGLELELNSKSQLLDLSQSGNLRVRLKIKELYTSIENESSFKIDLYEVKNGQRKFISSQNLTVNKLSTKNRIISIGAGHFDEPTKVIEIDLFDTENYKVNTYTTRITAINLDAQISANQNINFDVACNNDKFGECQMDAFFKNVKFVARKQRQASTRVIKGPAGYRVELPVPRDGFKFLKGGRSGKTASGGGSGGSGISTAGFGETYEVSTLRIGTGISDTTEFTYDDVNNQLELGFSPNFSNKRLIIEDSGKVGIGVDPIKAFLHIRQGNALTPSLILNPGILTTSIPANGSIEFDGTDFWVTKQGVRSILGQAFVGPNSVFSNHIANGTVGTADLADGAVTDAKIISVDGSKITGTISGSKITGDMSVGNITANDSVKARLFKGDVFNGGVFRGAFSGDGSGITKISGTSLNNGTVNNLTLKGLTVINGTSLKITTSSPVNGYVLTTDSNGITRWASPGSLSGTGDNLGNHSATQNLLMNNNDISSILTAKGNLADFTKFKGDGFDITNLNFNAFNGKSLTSTTLNGVTLKNPTLNGNIIFTDNYNLVKLSLTGSLTSPVINTSNIKNIENQDLLIFSQQNNNLTLQTEGSGLVKVISISNKSNGAILKVNGTVFANQFNGTFFGDGSGLRNVKASSIDNNSIFTNHIFNGTVGTADLADGAVTDAKIISVDGSKITGTISGSKITGDMSVGNITADDSVKARLFKGDVFNGGVFRGAFSGDGSGITKISGTSLNNGTVNNLTLKGLTVINGTSLKITTSSPVNGYVLTTDSNGITRWASPGSLSGTGDNLGNHSATQNLLMNNNDISSILTAKGNLADFTKFKGDGFDITNLNFNAFNGKSLTSTTLNGVTLKNPTLNGNIIFTDNYNLVKLSLTGSLTSPVINTSNIKNIENQDLLIFSQQNNNLTLQTEGSGLVKVISISNKSNGAILKVNGTVFANQFNGTFFGDGSGLRNVKASSIDNNSIFTNHIFNGTVGTADLADGAVTDAKIISVDGSKITGTISGSKITGDMSVGNITADDSVKARLFKGDVFNGGVFRGAFSGDGSGITKISGTSLNNGTVNNLTLKGLTVINGTSLKITTSSPVNGYVLTTDSNGITRWASPGSLSGTGDNLGNHSATQNLLMNNNDISSILTAKGNLADFTKFKGDGFDITNLNFNAFNGKSLTSTTLNGVTLKNPTLNGNIIFTDNYNLVKLSLTGSLTSPVINTSNIKNIENQDLLIFSQQNNNLTLQTEGSGLVKVISISNKSNGAILKVNGTVFANQFNGTFFGDGSALRNVKASSIDNNSIFTNHIFNGTVGTVDLADGAITDAKIISVDGSKITGTISGSKITGDMSVGNITADDSVKARLFKGDVFNGGVFRGAFSGDGSGITKISGTSLNNGTVNNLTLKGLTVINGTSLKITTSSPVNGYVLTTDSNGVTRWTAPGSLSGTGDNLGNHSATQNLLMNNNDISSILTAKGNLADFTKFKGDGFDITNLNFNAFNGKSLTSTTLNGVTLKNPTLNGNIIFTDNYNLVKLSLTGSLTSPVINTSNIKNIENQDLLIFSQQNNNLTLQTEGSGLVKVISTSNESNGAILKVNGNVFANQFNGTFFGDGSALRNVKASSLDNDFANRFLLANGDDNYTQGTLEFNTGTSLKISGDAEFKDNDIKFLDPNQTKFSVTGDLSFITNTGKNISFNSDKLVLTSAGNLGLGTSTPSAMLDVGGGTLGTEIDGINDLLVKDDAKIGNNLYAKNFKGDGYNITNLNFNAFNGKSLTSTTLNGVTLKNPTLNGNIIFTDNYNLVKLSLTGSLTSPVINTSNIKNIENQDLLIFSQQNNNLTLQTEGSGLVKVISISNKSNGAILKVNGNVFANQFNGTFFGDGSGLKNVKASSLDNDFANRFLLANGDDNYTQGTLEFNTGTSLKISGDAEFKDNDIKFLDPNQTKFSVTGDLSFITNTGKNISFNSDKLVLTSAGNLGLGTSTPSAMLDVGGGTLGTEIDGINDLLVKDDAKIGNNLYAKNFKGDGYNITNLNFNAFNGKSLTSTTLNGVTLKNPTLNGNIIFTDNYNLVKLSLTGSLTSPVINTSTINNINNKSLIINSTQNNNLVLQTEGSGLVKVISTSNVSNGAILKVNGNVFANQFNGTFFGDGSGLKNVKASSLDNDFANRFLLANGDDNYTQGTLEFNTGTSLKISGDAEFKDNDIKFLDPNQTKFSVTGDLSFITNTGKNISFNSDKLVLTSAGNLGLGTSTPSAMLDVGGGTLGTEIDGINDLLVKDDAKIGNNLYAKNFKGDGYNITNLNFNAFNGKSLTSTTLNGVTLKNPTLNGNIIFTDNYNLVKLSLTGSLTSPVINTSTINNINNKSLIINSTQNNNLVLQTEGSGLVKVISTSNVSNGAILKVNGNVFANQFNGTFFGDGSGLKNVKASSLDNDFANRFLLANGDDNYTQGTLEFNTGTSLKISGDAEFKDNDIKFLDPNQTKFSVTGDLSFITNTGKNISFNSDKLVLTSAGNLGLGTSTPSAMLDVGGGTLGTEIDGINDLLVKDDAKIGNNLYAKNFKGDGYNITNLNFNAFNGKSLTSTTLNGVTLKNPTLNGNIIFTDNYNLVKLSLTGSLTSPVINTSTINNINNKSLIINSTQNNNLVLQTEGSGLVKVISTSNVSNGAILKVNGNVFANQFNGTFFGDGSGLKNVKASSLDNDFANRFLLANGDDNYTQGTLEFNTGTSLKISGDAEFKDNDIKFLDPNQTKFSVTGDLSFITNTGKNISFNSDKLVLTSAGNLGLGTSTPSAMLDVGGGTLGTEIDGINDLLVKDDAKIGNNLYVTGAVNGSNAVFDGLTTDLQVYAPGSIEVNAASGIISEQLKHSVLKIKGANGAVNMATGVTQIATDTMAEGQMLILKGRSDMGSDTVTFDTGDGLILSQGVSFIMGPNDVLILILVDGAWIEVSRTDN